MHQPRPTLAGISEEIIRMYRTLLGDKAVDALRSQKQQNLISRRLRFLDDAMSQRVTLDSLTQEQALLLQETLLDTSALRSATGPKASVFAPLIVENPKNAWEE